VTCGHETWKHPIQAFVRERGNMIPIGAICEVCLRRPARLLARLCEPSDVLVIEPDSRLPTYDDLARARKDDDIECEWAVLQQKEKGGA
jgi:hypothetical protein